MVNELSSGVSNQTFLLSVSRANSIIDLINEEDVPLTCPQIRSLFFLEATTEGALNSDFFDSGVPINVTKVLEPTGSGSGDIFPGLDEDAPVPITQLFPAFSMFSRSNSDPLQP